ncbi:MAG: hypothetical protein POH28_06150 [Acidocella sp.]|nr:hypothetical protein [Acidocella sp.]
MAAQKDDTPELLRFPRSASGLPASANPSFNFGPEEDAGPEMELIGADSQRPAASTPAPLTGIDLSGRHKIIFWVGRGKTGKTTGIRWLAEKTLMNGTPLLMADLDTTNDTFSRYIDKVARPPEAADPALSLKWLDKLLQHSLSQKLSALVDLGGGDTTLRRLAMELPDLVGLFEAQGFAVVLFHTVGPQEEDLSPLATLHGLGFKPTATAIILNEAMMEIGETRQTAFARILRHSVVRRAIGEGAVPVFMPKLFAAQAVEIRRLKFHDAATGKTGRADTPLGPFDRSRVKNWLTMMDSNFAGISTWLP